VLGRGENKFEVCQWLPTPESWKIWRKSGKGILRWGWVRDNTVTCKEVLDEVPQKGDFPRDAIKSNKRAQGF
jgi:hypothetical protein